MARILVTGARGLLGSTLVPHLRSRGHDVVCHARSQEAELRGDLCDPHQARAVLEEARAEVVINLVALTDVDEAERNPQAAYLLNVRIVENLVDAILSNKNSSHLVQVSTDQLYDGPGPNQEDAITLRNYYAFSKYAGELVADRVASTVLRTNFFGPSRSPGRTSLSDWLVQSLTRGDAITVFADVRFSPLSLDTLVRMVERVVTQRHTGVYNLGSKEGMSKAEFAYALAAVLNLSTRNVSKGASDQKKMTAQRPKDMCLDSSRFEKQFGVQLPTLRDELQAMKEAYGDATR